MKRFLKYEGAVMPEDYDEVIEALNQSDPIEVVQKESRPNGTIEFTYIKPNDPWPDDMFLPNELCHTKQ